MQITSSYYRFRQHKETLDIGVGSGFARVVDQAALKLETEFCIGPKLAQPLRPSPRTLRRLARHYKSTHNLLV